MEVRVEEGISYPKTIWLIGVPHLTFEALRYVEPLFIYVGIGVLTLIRGCRYQRTWLARGIQRSTWRSRQPTLPAASAPACVYLAQVRLLDAVD